MEKLVLKLLPQKIKNLLVDLNEVSNLRKELNQTRFDVNYLKLLNYFSNNPNNEYKDEIEFLKQSNKIVTYPYKIINTSNGNTECGFDKKINLSFVVHNNKKLFFPRSFSTERALFLYEYLVQEENILDGIFLEKRPHQYTVDNFNVFDDDILLDVGAAEGLFTLHNVEKIRRGYVIEYEKEWIEALNATFKPYKNKIIVVPKIATERINRIETTIDEIIKNERGNIFIKMDVEGNEEKVLMGASRTLNRKENIRIACASYHNQKDAIILEEFFRSHNYTTEFSDGYLLFFYDKNFDVPYFRKGIIRASNCKF